MKDGSLLDEPLRLSELLHPGTFLNALRQQSARAMKVRDTNVPRAR